MTALQHHTYSQLSSCTEFKHPDEKVYERNKGWVRNTCQSTSIQSFSHDETSFTNTQSYRCTCTGILSSHLHLVRSLSLSLKMTKTYHSISTDLTQLHTCKVGQCYITLTQRQSRMLHPCTHDSGVMYEVWTNVSQLVHPMMLNIIWNTTLHNKHQTQYIHFNTIHSTFWHDSYWPVYQTHKHS